MEPSSHLVGPLFLCEGGSLATLGNSIVDGMLLHDYPVM